LTGETPSARVGTTAKVHRGDSPNTISPAGGIGSDFYTGRENGRYGEGGDELLEVADWLSLAVEICLDFAV
jgi:hypothetical protein